MRMAVLKWRWWSWHNLKHWINLNEISMSKNNNHDSYSALLDWDGMCGVVELFGSREKENIVRDCDFTRQSEENKYLKHSQLKQSGSIWNTIQLTSGCWRRHKLKSNTFFNLFISSFMRLTTVNTSLQWSHLLHHCHIIYWRISALDWKQGWLQQEVTYLNHLHSLLEKYLSIFTVKSKCKCWGCQKAH